MAGCRNAPLLFVAITRTTLIGDVNCRLRFVMPFSQGTFYVGISLHWCLRERIGHRLQFFVDSH